MGRSCIILFRPGQKISHSWNSREFEGDARISEDCVGLDHCHFYSLDLSSFAWAPIHPPLKSAAQAAQDRLVDSLKAMSSADRKKLARLLDRFVAGMGFAESGGEPGLFFEEKVSRKSKGRAS